MLAAGHLRPSESRPDFEGLGCGDGEHRVPELRLEFVKDRLSETGRDVADDASDSATDGIVRLLRTKDAL